MQNSWSIAQFKQESVFMYSFSAECFVTMSLCDEPMYNWFMIFKEKKAFWKSSGINLAWWTCSTTCNCLCIPLSRTVKSPFGGTSTLNVHHHTNFKISTKTSMFSLSTHYLRNVQSFTLEILCWQHFTVWPLSISNKVS